MAAWVRYSHSFAPSSVAIAPSEVAALDRARAEAQPGDFVLLLVHLDHDPVQAFLAGWK